ncbi:MAG TPA: arsenite methyltransferase [Actinomycetota bacterium]|nr:arsenite methyltransferase [Actinomycetota bacterium]
MQDAVGVQQAVRRHYAELAVVSLAPSEGGCCGGDAGACGCGAGGTNGFGTFSYDDLELESVPQAAADAALGSGNPPSFARLKPGERVLDLGCGGGIDVILAAGQVGPTGRVSGIDMTDEMVELAQRNVADAGLQNVDILKGTIEDLPLPSESVDVVLSNCVINLSVDKARALTEAARVLRPGGRLAVSDVVADPELDEATRTDMQWWTGCIAGALTADEYRKLLAAAGLVDVSLVESHRVHRHAGSAIIRARKPALPD